jgi:hypothetical protein
MPEYEFVDVYVPRGVSRKDATRLLTDHAEYGHWELDRLSLLRDGSRRVRLRRPDATGCCAARAGVLLALALRTRRLYRETLFLPARFVR